MLLPAALQVVLPAAIANAETLRHDEAAALTFSRCCATPPPPR